MSAIFRFDFKRAIADRSGYLFTNWCKAVPISVHASTQKDAETKAFALSGEAPRSRYWLLQIVNIEEVFSPVTEEGITQ